MQMFASLRRAPEGTNSSLVRFQNVGLRYGLGPEVLRDVSFRLKPGSFQFLTGPSGAGKTSLLKIIYLALQPTRGMITLFGQDLSTIPRKQLPPLRRRIGVVFQDYRLVDDLTAGDNVALPLRITGAKKQDIETKVAELLDWVGLGDQIMTRPPTMSEGEKQRVAIARAVIAQPSLLVADEPTGNIDADQGVRILRLFEQLNKVGTTVVIATHDQYLLTQFKHPVLRLEDGALAVQQPPLPLGPGDGR